MYDANAAPRAIFCALSISECLRNLGWYKVPCDNVRSQTEKYEVKDYLKEKQGKQELSITEPLPSDTQTSVKQPIVEEPSIRESSVKEPIVEKPSVEEEPPIIFRFRR